LSPAPRRTSPRASAPAARRASPRASAAADDAIEARRRVFERYFHEVLPDDREPPQRLHEAMRYSALGPGKRLRPLLTLCACEAVGGDWRRALPAAAAVELVHAFSLVHDDLPAMDDDDLRRGRPTTHRQFDEATAILAGDALLALAFQELCLLAGAGVPAAHVVEAVEWLAYCAGSLELVGGQSLDLAAEGADLNPAQVEEIDTRKTGALMSAALQLGGLAGGATEAHRKALGVAGRHLGIAFQITDDLLNRRSSAARLGKKTGTDARRGKATYPRAAGEKAARERAGDLIAQAIENVRLLGAKARVLEGLILSTAARDR
jgi:geranylgeranyl pyrophosphate synthase